MRLGLLIKKCLNRCRFFIFTIILSFLCSSLTSCKLGPNFYSPLSPPVKSYTGIPQSKKTVGSPALGSTGHAQYFANGHDIPAEWWTLFHSTTIDYFIRLGLEHSPNIVAALAAIQEAQENVNAQVGTSLFPAVNLQLATERQRFSAATLGLQRGSSTFNLYTPQVTVSYTLDVFGGARRQIEALCAQVDYQHFQLEGAYLTLTSNIVKTIINLASLQAQITATNELIQIQENLLTIVERQFQVGGASRADVLAQESLLAQTRASLPPLMQNLTTNQHALAALVGAFPADNMIPPVNFDQLRLPTQLPLSLPSLLVRQRPDVRAQEALLHAASAQIGVATANLFPQITLNGSYGWAANTIGTLFINRTSFGLSPALFYSHYSTVVRYTQNGGQQLMLINKLVPNTAKLFCKHSKMSPTPCVH
jgi:NodT family efflux transporter outer membrane factor (OMF) lipoprotein